MKLSPCSFNQQVIHCHDVFSDPSLAQADLLPLFTWLDWAVTAWGQEIFHAKPGSSASTAIMCVLCMVMLITFYHKLCNICSSSIFIPLLTSEKVTLLSKRLGRVRKRVRSRGSHQSGGAKCPFFQALSFILNSTVDANGKACARHHVVHKPSLYHADFMFC